MKTKYIMIIALIVVFMSTVLIGCTQNDVGIEQETESEVVELAESACESESELEQESELSVTEPETETKQDEPTYQQNEAYKMFYGTWEYVSVVSQHGQLGGEEEYEKLIGLQVTYLPEEYRSNGAVIYDPTYLISVLPLNGSSSFLDTQKQIDVSNLMPKRNYFAWVQIANKPILSEADIDKDVFMQYGSEIYIGDEFLIRDDNTIYCFDCNCIYELKRVSYVEGYDPAEEISYQEAW